MYLSFVLFVSSGPVGVNVRICLIFIYGTHAPPRKLSDNYRTARAPPKHNASFQALKAVPFMSRGLVVLPLNWPARASSLCSAVITPESCGCKWTLILTLLYITLLNKTPIQKN